MIFRGLSFLLNVCSFHRFNFCFSFSLRLAARIFLLSNNRHERYYKSNDKDWRDKRRVSITIRHCNVWRSRTSREVVIPTMGSDLRGRSDGASRRSHPRTLSLLARNSFLRIVYKGTTMRHGDESRGTWSKFPGRSREITTDKVHDDRRIMRTMKV